MRRDRAHRPRSGRHRFRAALLRVLVATGLVAGVVAFAAEPLAGASAWTIAPSPSPFRPERIALSAVSCAAPASCFAVGRRFDINEDETGIAIERWNGTTWSTMVNTIDHVTGAGLRGVSCATSSSCLAVGASSSGPIGRRWNGHQWKDLTPTKQGTSSSLDAVDCATATNCWAVGNYRAGSKTRALIEHWNGTTWKVFTVPQLGAASRMVLNGVSCASTTSCFAVGNHEEPGDQVGGVLIERWDGTNWSAMSAPNPKFEKYVGLPVTPLLTSVSCTGPKRCMGVGFAPESSLIERWNGTSWSIVKSPAFTKGTLAELRGVSCASATDCSAVGTKLASIDAREGVPLRNSINEHWNGTDWKVVPKPAAVPTNTSLFEVGQLADLNGVSCPAKTSCAAVGSSAMPERWNGSKWSLAALAASTSSSGLSAVSCPAPTTCLAIGNADARLDSATHPLAERWDGATWSVVPSATPAGKNVHTALESISCVSPTDCTAVGTYWRPVGGHARGRVLIERWNGTEWSLVPNPNPLPATALHAAALHAVSCVSATDCNAVGDYVGSSGQTVDSHLLAEHWDGTAWSIVSIPGPGTASWSGAWCSSATNCFAVGNTETGAAQVARWDGTQWTGVPSPAPPSGSIYAPRDVTCVSDTDCTLVGYRGSTTVVGSKTLIEHWNGTVWSVVTSPTPAGRDESALYAVACASATSCVAVGTLDGYRAGGHPAPLIEEWNGTAWSVVTGEPASGATAAELNGVAPVGTGYAAVGAWTARRVNEHTLVEQRS